MTKVKRFTVNLDFQPASFTFICMVFIFSCLRSRQLKLINNKMTGGDFYCEGFTVEEKKSMCVWRSLVWFLFSLLSFFFYPSIWRVSSRGSEDAVRCTDVN